MRDSEGQTKQVFARSLLGIITRSLLLESFRREGGREAHSQKGGLRAGTQVAQ